MWSLNVILQASTLSWKSENQNVNKKFPSDAETLKAYEDYERQLNIGHLDVACYLIAALMPLGMILDYFVYPEKIVFFFKLRLLCAFLAGVIWLILRTPIRDKI